ncbi:MAG: hypothetical protein V1737_00745 [Chloroflexota bacterium]
MTDWESAKNANADRFKTFFHALLGEGIYWPCAQFEAAFVSLAHSDGDIRLTAEVVDRALRKLTA